MSDYLGGNIKQHFNYLLESGNETAARQFLDHQTISDVADLINEFPEQEGYIITHMSIHRAYILKRAMVKEEECLQSKQFPLTPS